MSEEDKSTEIDIPLARVKRMVKQDPAVKAVSADAYFLITKSTELFIEYLAQEAWKETEAKKRSTIQYDDLASVVKKDEKLEFLSDIIPQRQPYRPPAQQL